MIVRRLGMLWARMRDTVRNELHALEFQAELEEHVRLPAEQYRRHGVTVEAAMLAARRQFGNTTLLEQDCGQKTKTRSALANFCISKSNLFLVKHSELLLDCCLLP